MESQKSMESMVSSVVKIPNCIPSRQDSNIVKKVENEDLKKKTHLQFYRIIYYYDTKKKINIYE